MCKSILQHYGCLLKESGLTLIELLVVIAVIGILSSLAVSNYEISRAQSLQAEAKIALAGIYTAQKGFYSEYSAYIPAFDTIGFVPEGNRRFYALGWIDAPWPNTISGLTAPHGGYSYQRLNTPNAVGFHNSCNALNLNGVLSSVIAAPFNQNDPQQFNARAAGNLRFNTPCDVWEIDELKRLRNTAKNL